jgi:hypothetical protein
MRTSDWHDSIKARERSILERSARVSGHVLKLLEDPLAAVRASQLRHSGRLKNAAVAARFCFTVSNSMQRIVHLDDEGRPEPQREYPEQDLQWEDPERVLDLYLQTTDTLFRSWAQVMPNAIEWNARNRPLGRLLEQALANREVVPDYSRKGVRGEYRIPAARSLSHAAKWRASLLFWEYLRSPQRLSVRICANAACKRLFYGRSDKLACSTPCSSLITSKKSHRNKVREENEKRIKRISESIDGWIAGSKTLSWRQSFERAHPGIAKRWLTDLLTPGSRVQRACPSDALSPLVAKVQRAENLFKQKEGAR